MEINHISPSWNINEFRDLEFNLAFHKDQKLIQEYLDLGYSEHSLSLYNYFEPNKMPSSVESYIKPYFNFLENVSVAINLFRPGQFIPYHSDLYQRYCEVNQITDINSLMRCILMLEDGKPGQILEIENQAVVSWKAGDWFFWKGAEKHAFYNFSKSDRYAIQVTGVIKTHQV